RDEGRFRGIRCPESVLHRITGNRDYRRSRSPTGWPPSTPARPAMRAVLAVAVRDSAAIEPPVIGRPPAGTVMGIGNELPTGALATGTTGKALPPNGIDVEMRSPNIRPWLVFGSQDRVIGPAIWTGALQVAPPLVDEMNPTLSWQVDAEQEP